MTERRHLGFRTWNTMQRIPDMKVDYREREASGKPKQGGRSCVRCGIRFFTRTEHDICQDCRHDRTYMRLIETVPAERASLLATMSMED